MFRAYGNNGLKNPERISGENPDLYTQTRAAVQQRATTTLKRNEKQKLAVQNDSVFQQVGIGESDSDDDNGGVRVRPVTFKL